MIEQRWVVCPMFYPIAAAFLDALLIIYYVINNILRIFDGLAQGERPGKQSAQAAARYSQKTMK